MQSTGAGFSNTLHVSPLEQQGVMPGHVCTLASLPNTCPERDEYAQRRFGLAKQARATRALEVVENIPLRLMARLLVAASIAQTCSLGDWSLRKSSCRV